MRPPTHTQQSRADLTGNLLAWQSLSLCSIILACTHTHTHTLGSTCWAGAGGLQLHEYHRYNGKLNATTSSHVSWSSMLRALSHLSPPTLIIPCIELEKDHTLQLLMKTECVCMPHGCPWQPIALSSRTIGVIAKTMLLSFLQIKIM